MGSNMAEAHPVGFRWPMKAKEKGATLIHVDPRFTPHRRMCDIYVGIRAGTRHRLPRRADQLRPDARAVVQGIRAGVHERRDDHRGGVPGHRGPGRHLQRLRRRRAATTTPAKGAGATRARHGRDGKRTESRARRPDGRPAAKTGGRPRHARLRPDGRGGQRTASRARHPTDAPGRRSAATRRCSTRAASFQILKKHFARYTPEVGRRGLRLHARGGRARRRAALRRTPGASGPARSSTPSAGRSTRPACRSSAPPASCSCCWATSAGPAAASWRCAGTASIQGSHRHPDALRPAARLPAAAGRRRAPREARRATSSTRGCPTGYWANIKKFIVSLLKAWYGDAATAENDFRFDWLPRIDGDYSQLPFFNRMAKGEVKGYFLFGQNPGGGGPERRAAPRGAAQARLAGRARLVRDRERHVLEERPDGPAAARDQDRGLLHPRRGRSPEKEGSFTNTQRLLQWHDKARGPAGRLPLRPVVRLQPRQAAEGAVRRLDEAAGPGDPDTSPGTTTTTSRRACPTARSAASRASRTSRRCCRRSTAIDLTRPTRQTGKPKLLPGFSELKDDGIDRLRLLDLLAASSRATTATAPASASVTDNPRAAGVGLRLAAQPPDHVQPRLGRPAGQAVVGAQEAHLVGRAAAEVGRRRRARLPARQAARLPAAAGRQGHGRDRRRRSRSS